MRRRNIIWGLAAACIVIAGLLLYHPAKNSEPVTVGRQTDTLKIAGEDYGYPTPYAFYPRGPGYMRMSLLFDTLVWKDKQGFIPWLCDKYEMSANGQEWTFFLHPDVKWHDGQPLTAKDVKFTFDYIKEHPHPWYSQDIGVIDKVEAIGAAQVKVFLKKPYAPFLANVAASIPIMPQHIWEKVGDPLKFTDPVAVVGSGPFKLVKYDKAGALYIFEANPEYFKGSLKVGKLIFMQPGQPLFAMQNGEIDGFNPDADQVTVLKAQPNVKIIEDSGSWVVRLMFNLAQPPFNQVKFRQAVAYALNLPDIVFRSTHNGATPGSPGYIAPELAEWYNPNITQYPYNPEKAKQLLAELGYTRVGPDGILATSDGRRLSFELLTFQQGQDGEIVKNMLAAVGIDVQLKALEKGAHDQLIAAGQFQMAINGHGGLTGDPAFLYNLISPFIASTAKPSPANSYQNEEFSNLFAAQIGMTDIQERRQAVFRMQEIVSRELPTIPLYYRKSFLAYRSDKLDGWFFTPGGLGIGIPSELNKIVFLQSL